MKDSTRAALYVRVSTDAQTTDNQEIELKAMCQRRGWSVAATYRDGGLSGATTTRPALDEMLADARRGRIDAVVVWKLDRLGRSVAHLLEVLADLKTHGVAFASATEAIDTTTAQGRMLLVFLAGIAEFERELIKERVNAGIARAKAAGVTFGRPRTAFDVQRAVELRAQGWGWKRIADELRVPRTTLFRSLRAIPKPIAAVEG